MSVAAELSELSTLDISPARKAASTSPRMPIGNVAPAEAEALFFAQSRELAMVA